MESFDYVVSKEIEGRLGVVLDGLSRGTPTDYSEYCKLVGEIRGLRFAQTALVEARKQMGIDDE